MFSHSHLISGILVALIGYELHLIGPAGLILVPLISVLIDLDHFLIYALEKRTLNIKNFLNSMAKNHDPHYRSFIHRKIFLFTVIFVTIGLFLINKQSSFIIAGSYFPHIILDRISSIDHWLNIYKQNRIGNIYIKLSKLEHILDSIMVLGIIILIL